MISSEAFLRITRKGGLTPNLPADNAPNSGSVCFTKG